MMQRWILLCLLALVVCLTTAQAEDKPEPPSANTPTLYTVGYAHLDTQWRWTYYTTIKEYIPNTLHDNFALFERYPDYVFNFSGSNRYRMMKEYYPEDYARLQQYVAQGRWFPCGSSVEECDVNTVSAESVIRQVLYGNEYFRKELGQASEEFMLPDCFGFPASLPSLLGHCGLKGFSTQKLTWGSANGIPFNVGIWDGLDGKSLIAAFNPGSYGGRVTQDLSHNEGWLKRINEEGAATGVFKDYMYYGTGDIGGSPTPESVYWIEKSLAGGGPLKVLSTPADQMFRDITPDAAKKLPHYTGDLLLTEHSAGSITSQAYMKRWNHQNELLADSAERAAVAASWLGGMAYPQAKLNNAWTLVLGGQFHDILPGTSHPDAYVYSQGDEVLALNQFADVLQTAAASVISGMDTAAQGVPVVVYNPLSIERQDVVEAEVEFPGAAGAAVTVMGPDGAQVPAQMLSRDGSRARILFLATTPSVGFAVYDVRPVDAAGNSAQELSASESGLENARYSVKLNANGDVASIFDKQVQRELLTAPIRLAYTHDKPSYWPAWNIDWADQQKPPQGYVDGPATISVIEQGPVRATVRVERLNAGSRFVQDISLAAAGAGNRVEFRNKIDWRGKQCNLKAVFPLTVANPQATYNWESGTILRGNNDPKKYEVPAHQWFDLTDTKGDYGVTVLAPCKYGSDKPDDSTLRLTLLRTPGAVDMGYRDQEWQDWGRHDITFGLAGHKQGWRAGQTDWEAMRLDQPLVAFQDAAHAGSLGRSLSLLWTSNPRVRVMAVKQAENSDETIIRLVELSGMNQRAVQVAFAAPVVAAREVDGQERPLGEAKLAEGKLVADFTPYAMHTFAVKLAPPSAKVSAGTAATVALPYDTSVASRDDEIALQGFDGDRRCLAAEMLPQQLVDGGVPFKLAPAGGNQPNAVRCAGQELALPAGDFNRFYFLAAGSPGDQEVEFLLDGQPVKLKIQDWGGRLGQWDTRVWNSGTPEVAFEWPYELVDLTPGYIKPATVAWFCSHRHNSSGQNEIYEYTYLYRYSIALPPGAKTLKLPDNGKVMLLAATVANNGQAGVKPVQPLYDTLKDHAGLGLEVK